MTDQTQFQDPSTPFIVYDPESGQILRSGACPLSMVPLQGQPVLIAEGSDADFWIQEGQTVPRPTMPLQLLAEMRNPTGPDEFVINGIPLGATCAVQGMEIVCSESVLHYTTDLVGPLEFRFTLFPYKPATIFAEAL